MSGAPFRAVVPPVPEGEPRPLWSVMVPTYNCARYLRRTLESVLAQDPGPEQMQVEVVDDRSTADDPEAVVREVGRGRVGFFRQAENVGHVRNFDTCLRRSRGRLVHLLHGDDAVLPGFYAAMQRAFEARPEIGAAFCRHVFMDGEGRRSRLPGPELPTPGVLPDALLHVAARQPFQTPAAGPGLPAGEAAAVRRSVLSRCAEWGIGLAVGLLAAGQPAAAGAQLREALRCRATPRNLARAAVLSLRLGASWAGGRLRSAGAG